MTGSGRLKLPPEEQGGLERKIYNGREYRGRLSQEDEI